MLEARKGVVARGLVDDARLGHAIVETKNRPGHTIGGQRSQHFLLVVGIGRLADRGGALQQLIEARVEAGAAQRAMVRDTDDCESSERDDQQSCQPTERA